MTLAYEQHKEAANLRQQQQSAACRDIAGGYRPPSDTARREACQDDPERWLRTYHAAAFDSPFASYHRKLIQKTEDAINAGGLYAQAAPRGTGKTAIFVRMGLRAFILRKRRFGVIIGATQRDANRMMHAQKSELWTNPLLQEDWPEVCYPFACLEGKAQKARGQLWAGEPTHIAWNGDLVASASIPPNRDVCVLCTRAITGAIKGLNHTMPGGEILRPDFVLLDDVQTRESAKSLIATEDRIQTIDGDVLGLAGHDRRITAVMAVTPIYDGDLACTYLDRQKKPDWQGETARMVEAMPAREDLWDQYRQIADEARRNDGDPLACQRFYAANQADMQAGAVLSWPERYPPAYLDALEYAMALKFRSAQAFAAEYQCEPLKTAIAPGMMLSADEIARKVNGLGVGVVPDAAQWLTGFIDVHDGLLYWSVIATGKDFTSAVVDYGTFPQQRRRHFALTDAAPTIAEHFELTRPDMVGATVHSMLAAALDHTLGALLDRQWARANGESLGLSRLLVDTGYEKDLVFAAIRRVVASRPTAGTVVMPSKGLGITSTRKPLSEYKPKPGDMQGWHWRAAKPAPNDLRVVDVDTNHFKRFLHQQLFTARERPGSLTLYGDSKTDHTLLSQHYTAEVPKAVENKTDDRSVVEWTQIPNRDNHWLDCAVGCLVGASMLGAELPGTEEATPRKKHRPILKLSDLRNGRG